MQRHVQQDDLTHPGDFAPPLSAEPGVLRHACYCVGITLDPRRPWDIPAPPPRLTLGCLLKALSSVGLVPGPEATSLTLRSVVNKRGEKWLPGRPTVSRAAPRMEPPLSPLDPMGRLREVAHQGRVQTPAGEG